LLPELAVAGVQLATRVGPVFTVVQYVDPPGTQFGVGLQTSELESHEKPWLVDFVTWLV